MATSTTFKRGSTFSYAGQVTLPAGTWSAEAQLWRGGVKVADLDVTLTPPGTPGDPHTILLEKAATDTAGWPVDELRGDIVFSDGSTPAVEVASSTFTIDVVAEVTR